MKSLTSLIILSFFSLSNQLFGQWATNGNHIYNTNSGFVGIGSNTPSTLLYVTKNMTEPAITVRNLGGTGGATFSMIDDASGAEWKFKATLNGGFKIRDHANGLDVLVIEPNSANNLIYVKSGGKIGIGTTNPARQLTVVGEIMAEGYGNSTTFIGPTGLHINRAGWFYPGYVINLDSTGFLRVGVGNFGAPGFGSSGLNIHNSGYYNNFGFNVRDAKTTVDIGNGDIYIEEINRGVIMKSPDGTCWRLTVDNSGVVTATEITCP